jgi:hypothetical protein
MATRQPDLPDDVSRASDEDTWLRHLIVDGEVTSAGTLHPNALRNLLRRFDRQGSRRWAHGISGRLKSLANDVEERAHSEAAAWNRRNNSSSGQFRGVFFQRINAIRAFDQGTYDVIHFVADKNDPAHGGIIRFSPLPRVNQYVPHHVVRALCEFFEFAAPGTVKLHRLLHKD